MTLPGFRKQILIGIVAIAALAAQCASGQVGAPAQASLNAAAPLPAFEVASIRPSKPGAGFVNFMIAPNRFRVENGTVTELIKFAYHIKSDDQLPKDPRWIGSDQFDVDAKIADAQTEAMNKLPPDQKFEQYRLMVRSLLMDRFKLQVSQPDEGASGSCACGGEEWFEAGASEGFASAAHAHSRWRFARAVESWSGFNGHVH